jgi:hypothetical protein
LFSELRVLGGSDEVLQDLALGLYRITHPVLDLRKSEPGKRGYGWGKQFHQWQNTE